MGHGLLQPHHPRPGRPPGRDRRCTAGTRTTTSSRRCSDHLLPRFDHSFSALLEDLDDRGLLKDTLVVCMGEFGRAPLVALEKNFAGTTPGRKHWARCYSVVLAGAGVRRGAVYGSLRPHGAYPQANPVTPGDLAATLFHALGIPADTHYADLADRPQRMTTGEPVPTVRLIASGSIPPTISLRPPVRCRGGPSPRHRGSRCAPGHSCSFRPWPWPSLARPDRRPRQGRVHPAVQRQGPLRLEAVPTPRPRTAGRRTRPEEHLVGRGRRHPLHGQAERLPRHREGVRRLRPAAEVAVPRGEQGRQQRGAAARHQARTRCGRTRSRPSSPPARPGTSG